MLHLHGMFFFSFLLLFFSGFPFRGRHQQFLHFYLSPSPASLTVVTQDNYIFFHHRQKSLLLSVILLLSGSSISKIILPINTCFLSFFCLHILCHYIIVCQKNRISSLQTFSFNHYWREEYFLYLRGTL